MADDGKTLAEIPASKPLADPAEKWGNSLVSTEISTAIITLVVHDSLTGQAYVTGDGE